MTAVVGILNKEAIAMAADSAVTIDGNNGRKIFNKANKIFTLSKEHPVGVMIYNSATFMGTPWETIIKVYRKQLGEKSFQTVREYQNDFIEFVREKHFFTSPEIQIEFLENLVALVIEDVIKEVVRQNQKLIENPSAENQSLILEALENEFDTIAQIWNNKNDYCPEFADYTFESFEAYTNEIFNRINQQQFLQNNIIISEELFLKIKRTTYAILRAKENISNFTGLIFGGFGEDEIYPQLVSLNISMAVDNRLRFYIDEKQSASITVSQNGAVRPFAQTDVIDTILSGIDPSLDNIYLNNFEALFNKYNNAIIESIGDTNPLLTEQIQKLDTSAIVKEFKKLNQQIKKENYISPLMNAVSNLSKEDLSEMAESLIYLTYLKRRITFAEESVGGPVDVAVISKGDGFVWIKRKHYFKPELNQHFFNNYFKK
ncbi:MAG TPA: hypothetical protein VFG10_00085 [Saprospiraceae bacterium]|nr:hypothetical protein [Saprospiraceae bacterium]